MVDQNQSALLPLDGERAVSFRDRRFGSNPFTLFFQRITGEAWKRFFSGIVIENERIGNAVSNFYDTRSTGSRAGGDDGHAGRGIQNPRRQRHHGAGELEAGAANRPQSAGGRAPAGR